MPTSDHKILMPDRARVSYHPSKTAPNQINPNHATIQNQKNTRNKNIYEIKQVTFADGQTESVVSLPILQDQDPNEGCESVTLGVTAVTGEGSAVVDGGIHDVSAGASVRIDEITFTSAVLETAAPEGLDVAAGGLSPATAEVGTCGWDGCTAYCTVPP